MYFVKEKGKSKKQWNMLVSLCCHGHLHDKMLRNLLLTKLPKYVQSRFIFPPKLICSFYYTQFSQCFLVCLEHLAVTQSTLYHCRAEISFNSSQRWAGAFTNSIRSWSKQKKFDQNYDLWEQIFFAVVQRTFCRSCCTRSSRHNEATFL